MSRPNPGKRAAAKEAAPTGPASVKSPAQSTVRTQAAPRPARVRAIDTDMVGFRLLKLTNLMSRPFFAQFAKRHALSLNEWRAIVVLATHPGSAAQDVAAITGLLPMNISRALATLRRAGMVEEARDPENHRRTLLWLTERGESTFSQIAPHSLRNARRLMSALEPAELAVFGVLLDKLIARAEEISLEDGGRDDAVPEAADGAGADQAGSTPDDSAKQNAADAPDAATG